VGAAAVERFGEDALVHQRRRHGEQGRQALVNVVALEAGEEERLVLGDRAAQGATVGVLVPRALLGAVEEVARIQRVVAKELVEVPAERVLAALLLTSTVMRRDCRAPG
jgi:hypothetical protein